MATVGGYFVTRARAPVSRATAVTDSVALADSAVGRCRASSGDAQMDCYDAFLVPVVASHGVRTAMGALHVLGTRDDQVRADGHVYAHAIGRDADGVRVAPTWAARSRIATRSFNPAATTV